MAEPETDALPESSAVGEVPAIRGYLVLMIPPFLLALGLLTYIHEISSPRAELFYYSGFACFVPAALLIGIFAPLIQRRWGGHVDLGQMLATPVDELDEVSRLELCRYRDDILLMRGIMAIFLLTFGFFAFTLGGF